MVKIDIVECTGAKLPFYLSSHGYDYGGGRSEVRSGSDGYGGAPLADRGAPPRPLGQRHIAGPAVSGETGRHDCGIGRLGLPDFEFKAHQTGRAWGAAWACACGVVLGDMAQACVGSKCRHVRAPSQPCGGPHASRFCFRALPLRCTCLYVDVRIAHPAGQLITLLHQ